jgi:V/A-type H+-transporting ATPase subunit B
VQEVKALAAVVGRDELGEEDKAYLAFGDECEKIYVNQAKDENRDIGQSLDMSWRLLSSLPTSALSRISMEDMEKYIKPNQQKKPEGPVPNKAAPAEAV